PFAANMRRPVESTNRWSSVVSSHNPSASQALMRSTNAIAAFIASSGVRFLLDVSPVIFTTEPLRLADRQTISLDRSYPLPQNTLGYATCPRHKRTARPTVVL